jgi:hypothetical protein
MNLPRAAFTIGTDVLHSKSQQEGTIIGIRRKKNNIEYRFDCDIFTSWVSGSKLEPMPELANVAIDETEDEQMAYKGYLISMTECRISKVIVIAVKLKHDCVYEREFPVEKQELARTFYDFLRMQDSVTTGTLETLEMSNCANAS